MNLTRRQFSSALAAAGTAAVSASLIPSPVFAQARARVVIIGGGAGGASVAQKLILTGMASRASLDFLAYSPHLLGNVLLG